MESKFASFITLDSCIKSALIDTGENGTQLYNRYLSWTIRAVNELGFDVFRHFKEALVKVDQNTFAAKLPDDYVQYMRVGLLNTPNEFLPFTKNDGIVFTQNIHVPACHCDVCGCNDDICESITEADVTNTEVTISTPVMRCNYAAVFDVGGAYNFTFKVVSSLQDGVTKQIQRDVTNEAGLDALMSELGWTKTAQYTYSISNQSILWGKFVVKQGSLFNVYVNEVSCTVGNEDVTYTNTEQVCVDAQGNITKEICLYGYNTYSTRCNYYLNLTAIQDVDFPLAGGSYAKGGQSHSITTINDFNSLIAFFEGLGFTAGSSTGLFYLNQSPDTWQTVTFPSIPLTVNFGSDSCTTQSVGQKCTTTHACQVEVNPDCGCIALTDATVNLLLLNGVIINQAYQRWIQGGSMLQTLAVAGNVLGYFNINKETNVIQFNQGLPYKAVYIQYYSANQVDSGDYLVPVQAQEAIIAYIDYKSKWSKSNAPLYEKQRAEKYWYNEKSKLKQRLSPLILQEFTDILRTLPIRP